MVSDCNELAAFRDQVIMQDSADMITSYDDLRPQFNILTEVMESPYHFAHCLKSILKLQPAHREALRKTLNYEIPFQQQAAELVQRYDRFGMNPPQVPERVPKGWKETPLPKPKRNILRDIVPRLQKSEITRERFRQMAQDHRDRFGAVSQEEKNALLQLSRQVQQDYGITLAAQNQ